MSGMRDIRMAERGRGQFMGWNANKVTTRGAKTDGENKNKAKKLAADR